MRARSVHFTAPETVEVRERDVPEPGPGEARVRTIASAISPGTELLVYRGEAPSDLPTDATIPALSGRLDFPLRYGYAAVGEVTAVGSGVDESWLGETVFSFNPHESHFLAAPDDLYPVPDGIDPAVATLLPTVETACTLVMDGRPVLGERVVVFGQGVVGLVTTALLASFPLDRLLTVEAVASRRERSRAFGADECLPPAEIRGRFDPGDAAPTMGADLSFELSGNPDALDDAVAITGYDGRVVVGSWYGARRADLDLGGRFHRSRIDVASSQVSTIDPSLRGRWDRDRRFELAWERLRTLDVDGLVTHRLPVEDAARAYRLLDDAPDEAVQILFTYGDA